jgi:predicted phage tail protein
MTERVRTVRLYGRLGARFGRVHRLAVASTAEAVRALAVLLPGFERELMTSRDRGVGYACFIGRRNLRQEQLPEPAGDNDIRIAPMVMGSKRGGFFSIVLGAALFFVAPYIAGAVFGAGGSIGLAAGISSFGMALGKMLIFSGISQLLSPQPKRLGAQDGPNNGASYNFNGPVNTLAQGGCVPLLYGELIVGSATVSAGIYSEDQA